MDDQCSQRIYLGPVWGIRVGIPHQLKDVSDAIGIEIELDQSTVQLIELGVRQGVNMLFVSEGIQLCMAKEYLSVIFAWFLVSLGSESSG